MINVFKLFDVLKKELVDVVMDFVNGDMIVDQVKKLVEVQIVFGNCFEFQVKLFGMGYISIGLVCIIVLDEGVKKLSEIYFDYLKLIIVYLLGLIKLFDFFKDYFFVIKVLVEFDCIYGVDIDFEVKMLVGEVGVVQMNLLVGFCCEVICEVLLDLNILVLVQVDIDLVVMLIMQILYEVCDMLVIVNDGIVYEGQLILNGGISQVMDLVYINLMKIVMLIFNEVMYFLCVFVINWDVFGCNIELNVCFLCELICCCLCNELQCSVVVYNVVLVLVEFFSLQLIGLVYMIKMVNFSIVCLFQQKDICGINVGLVENFIIIMLNSLVILQYDGIGVQFVGIYYCVLNWNLGYVQFVNQFGILVILSNIGINIIVYSCEINVLKVDFDIVSGLILVQQLNGIIRGVGSCKVMLLSQCFVILDFLLSSLILNDMVINVEQFIVQGKCNGLDIISDGDLQVIKGVLVFLMNVLGVDFGDECMIIGQCGLFGYVVVKFFQIGELFEVCDLVIGQSIGKK